MRRSSGPSERYAMVGSFFRPHWATTMAEGVYEREAKDDYVAQSPNKNDCATRSEPTRPCLRWRGAVEALPQMAQCRGIAVQCRRWIMC